MNASDLAAFQAGAGGLRVAKLLTVAMGDGDVPISSVALDLILAAAAVMVAVRTADPSASPFPPPEGSPKLQVAVVAVADLATSMMGKLPEAAS